jgi:glycosyltransferase involved in cell wall biosynthesis
LLFIGRYFFKKGGFHSLEAIDSLTGYVVEKGDVESIIEKVNELKGLNLEEISKACRVRAENFFDKNDRFNDYLKIYNELLNEKQ